MLKTAHFILFLGIVRQHDDVMISHIGKNLQWPEMHLCAKFGCSTLDFLGGVISQRNKQISRDFVYYRIVFFVPKAAPLTLFFLAPITSCNTKSLPHI